jgi:hypothetical protein
VLSLVSSAAVRKAAGAEEPLEDTTPK